MYKWDEMTERERDALVAEKAMKWTHCTVEGRNKDIAYGKPYGFDESDPVVRINEYTSDISAAWEVFQHMKQSLFSTRKRFMDNLQLVVSNVPDLHLNERVSWPDAFWFVTPEAICKAALITIHVEII